ncbi:winged helix-turn-helix transcriptional regulator [Corynebacterium stationis]
MIDSNVPPRVKYELTDKGQNPAPIIAAIQQWDVEWIRLNTPKAGEGG